MKVLAITYFLISGILLFLKGALIVATAAHIGQPVTSLYRHEILKTSVSGDAQRLKELETGLDHFRRQITGVIREGQEGGFLLCAVGALHLCIGAYLWIRRKDHTSHDLPSGTTSRT